MPEPTAANPLPDAEAWFAHRGWVPFPFQREVSQGKVNAESGVLHATAGKGKTEPGVRRAKAALCSDLVTFSANGR